MKTELLGQEKNIVKVKVEFEAAEFTASLNEAIQEIGQKASIPGFRKGHTPRKVIEMRFGRESLYNEVLEKIIPEAIEQVVGDYDLDTLGAPSLIVEDIHEGQPLVCELTFEVSPEVVLPELEDIEVEKLIPKVTDEMIDAMIKEFRNKHSALNTVERPVGEGDVVAMSYTTDVLDPDNAGAIQGSLQQNDIDLADPSIRQEIKNALLGKSKGDKAETEFEVDAEYQDKSVAGKKIRYDITVEEVKERVLPEMTPVFYKQVLEMQLDSEEAFKEELKKRMHDHLENENTSQASNLAINTIAGRAELDVPDTLLQRQMEFLKERDASETQRRFKKEMDEVLRMSGISLAEYEQGVREKALDIVRRTLVLDEIGKKFAIEVQKEEFEAAIDRMAGTYGIETAKLRAMFYKNKDRMMQTVDELRYEKIAKLIMEKVKIKDVDELSSSQKASDISDAAESAE